MSKFPLDRRDFLRTGSFTLLGAAGLSQTVEAQSTSGGDEIWSFQTGDDVLSSPTVVDGTVFVGSYDGNVYALDASDGSEEWSIDASRAVGSSPTVVDGTVFVGSGFPDYSVYALDASDGSEEWSFQTGRNVLSSPTVVDGTVFVGSNDNNVYALDAGDGGEEWSFQTDRPVWSSPTVVDGTVFVGKNNSGPGSRNVYALDANSGSEKWSIDAKGSVRSSPTVIDGTVFVGSSDGNVYALDANDGSEEWSFQTGDAVESSPTVADGTVFVGSLDDNVYALDAGDGSEEWSFQTGNSRIEFPTIESSPTVVDEMVFVGSNDGSVYALDASDGSEEWSFQTGDDVRSSPTVADGTVFVGSDDGNVYALDAGVSGSSEGSRVNLGTLGHDNTWTDTQGDFEPDSLPAQNGLAINRGVAYIVSASRDGEIQQIDLEERTVIDSFDAPEGSRARGLAYADGSLWFADGIDPDYDGEILELNPDTGEIRSLIETSYDPRGLAYGEGSLWVVDITTNDIVEYALDGTELGEFDIQGPTGTTTPRGLAYFDGSLWVGTIDGFLYKFSTGGSLQETTGERDATYGGLATTSTELLGPDEDENLTVLRTLGEEDDPEIDATSIDIDPYPVEKGDSPEIRIIVEGADEVDAILEKTDRSGAPATVTLDMEQEAEDQWAATDHSVSFDELGWWDLRIEAQSGTEESVTLDTFEIDDPRAPDEQEGEWLLEDQELGFHVFEEVADVAVVVGWFADEDPPTDSEVAELSAWFEARERDTNYYFGSNRGMRSLVGFNMELRLFESGEVFEIESREYYEEEVGDDAENEFMQDLKSTAFPSDGLESYDFWIGTNPGGDFGYNNGEHVTDVGGLWIPIRSRAPRRLEDDNIVAGKYIFSYNIWIHEICHAFGFGHPNDIGNQKDTHKCVTVQDADRLEPKNRNPTDEVAPVPPVSTLQYLTKELEYSLDVRPVIGESGLLETSDQIGYQREDWLSPVKTRLEDVDQNYSGLKIIDSLQSYDIGDSVHVLIANTGIFGHKVKYIFESRPFIKSEESTDYGPDIKWSNDQGALVIYKWEEPDTITTAPSYNVVKNAGIQRSLRTPGEEFRDELDDGRVIVFQLHNKQWKSGVGDPSGFSTEVKIKKEPSDSSTRTVTLDDPTSIPAGLDPSCFAEYTSPSLDLKAIDSEGRIVGINDDGRYVNQIPGAKASGKRVQGSEWISVPEDTDVDFRVSSADVERFIEDMEQLGTLADEPDESDDSVSKSELESKLTREYGVSQTTYGDNPELVEDDGETVVTDATTRVQREEIPPGDEKEATPRNPFSDVDIVAIYPDTESLAEERVVLTNHGTETLDATGWQITNESGNIFVMPEFELNPGQEVAIRTGTGEDTDTDLYRDTEQSQWNPDGGQVQLIDNTGTTILSVTYDDRGVIEYDDTREDDGEPSLADYAGSDDLIHLVGLRDAIDDWRDDIIGDELLNTVVDAWRTERKIEQKEVD